MITKEDFDGMKTALAKYGIEVEGDVVDVFVFDPLLETYAAVAGQRVANGWKRRVIEVLRNATALDATSGFNGSRNRENRFLLDYLLGHTHSPRRHATGIGRGASDIGLAWELVAAIAQAKQGESKWK